MCFLVMSLCSCDIITMHSMAVDLLGRFNYSSKAPGIWIVEHQLVYVDKVTGQHRLHVAKCMHALCKWLKPNIISVL